jgi:hypothetical protein
MRKSVDITKYDPDWQILRARIKGPQTPLKQKMSEAHAYYKLLQTVDAKERVMNWLEGLSMGYKASGDNQSILDIAQELVWYNEQTPSKKEQELSSADISTSLQRYSYANRLILWKDLFKRNEKWLKNGYFHKEHNDFSDLLYQSFIDNKEQIPDNYSKTKLDDLKKQSEKTANTHKFFF